MKSYPNREEKEAILSVLASMSCMENVAEMAAFSNAKEACAKAADACKEVAEIVMDQYDFEALRAMRNIAKNALITLQPKPAAGQEEMIIVPRRVVDELTAKSLMDCAICMKEGKEVKRCATRKALVTCMVEPRGNGACVYQVL